MRTETLLPIVPAQQAVRPAIETTSLPEAVVHPAKQVPATAGKHPTGVGLQQTAVVRPIAQTPLQEAVLRLPEIT